MALLLQPHMNPKYKTSLCKHWTTSKIFQCYIGQLVTVVLAQDVTLLMEKENYEILMMYPIILDID